MLLSANVSYWNIFHQLKLVTNVSLPFIDFAGFASAGNHWDYSKKWFRAMWCVAKIEKSRRFDRIIHSRLDYNDFRL